MFPILEKDMALHLNKFEFPQPRMLCANFGWNWSSGSGEEDESVNSEQTDRWTTDDQESSGDQTIGPLAISLTWGRFFLHAFYII